MKDLAKNPFLVVGVSADAEMSEIRQVAQRRMMEHRLDGGENSPAARRVESALEALQDPVQRFTWGLYWPELTAEEAEHFRDCPILSTLGDDPLQDGAVAYDLIAADVSQDIREHNLGVLELLQAVAATEEAQKGTPDDISDDLACCEIWERAFRHLLPVVSADAFWMRKKLWAKDLGDKRLNDARLKEIRESYVADLLAPTGAVITTALLDGHAKVAKAYVGVVKNSGFDVQVVEETLSRVYKPLADRVERAVEELKNEIEAARGKATESAFAALLARFEEVALPDLEVMLSVGDLPGYAEEHARDTAAEFLRNTAVASWNATHRAAVSERAIKLGNRIADSKAIRGELSKDLSTIQGLRKKQAAHAVLAPLYRDLEAAMERNHNSEVLRLIGQIIEKTPDDEQGNLKELRGIQIMLLSQAAAETRRPRATPAASRTRSTPILSTAKAESTGCAFWLLGVLVIAIATSSCVLA